METLLHSKPHLKNCCFSGCVFFSSPVHKFTRAECLSCYATGIKLVKPRSEETQKKKRKKKFSPHEWLNFPPEHQSRAAGQQHAAGSSSSKLSEISEKHTTLPVDTTSYSHAGGGQNTRNTWAVWLKLVMRRWWSLSDIQPELCRQTLRLLSNYSVVTRIAFWSTGHQTTSPEPELSFDFKFQGEIW